MTDEEKKEYEELKGLLYTGTISQYGKRKLIAIIEKQQAEIDNYKQLYGKALNDLVISEHDKLKKNRIIDLMAEKFSSISKGTACIENNTNKEKIKEYFTNKVEGGK